MKVYVNWHTREIYSEENFKKELSQMVTSAMENPELVEDILDSIEVSLYDIFSGGPGFMAHLQATVENSIEEMYRQSFMEIDV